MLLKISILFNFILVFQIFFCVNAVRFELMNKIISEINKLTDTITFNLFKRTFKHIEALLISE